MTILARQRLATWGVALALLPLAACNADRSNAFNATVPTPAAAAATMGVQDTKFINAAGPSDQFELQTSQVALERSRRADVRAYAQMMIDQHTASAQQLTLLAGAKGATGSAIEFWPCSAGGFWPTPRPSNLGCPRLCRGAQSGLERQSGFVRAAPSGA